MNVNVSETPKVERALRLLKAVPRECARALRKESAVQMLGAWVSTVAVEARKWLLYPQVQFGRRVVVDDRCSFEKGVVIGPDCTLTKTTVGRFSFCAFRDWVGNTSVGPFCSIGPNVIIGIGRHPARDFVSTHPVMFSHRFRSAMAVHEFEEDLPVSVGADVWIGANAFIGPGLRIGHGAIIGAGAVVTKDVEPYHVVAGVPARTLRSRFLKEQVDFLLETRWWEWGEERLRALGSAFSSVDALRAALEQDADRRRDLR